MMKILVIGSNSFSGSHFVKHALEKNHKVVGISRYIDLNPVFLPYKWEENKNKDKLKLLPNFKFKQIDLNKDFEKLASLIDKEEPELIFNFAAQGMVAESWKNPNHWYQTNLLSQVRLHEHLRKKTFLKKYIHITTPEVYGSTDNKWIKENENFSPSTPYAISRAACDMHLKSFYEAYNFPVLFTRAANVYGPGQQLYRIIPRTILSCITGQPFYLHGDGKSVRSFVYIEDVVDATLNLGINAEAGTTWHISTKEALSIKDLVSKICEITSVNYSEIVSTSSERLGKDQTYLLNSDLIREKFNWKDKVDLYEGIIKTINWVNKNLKTLKMLSWEYQHKE